MEFKYVKEKAISYKNFVMELIQFFAFVIDLGYF